MPTANLQYSVTRRSPRPDEHRSIIATILFRARDNAAKKLADTWEGGATGVSVGMLAYEMTVKAMERAYASGRFQWLWVNVRGRELVFTVDGRMYKFYRGDPEDPASPRHREPSLFEETELAALERRDPSGPGVHRFIIDATPKGFPQSVYCARVTDDGVSHDVDPISLVPMSRVDIAFESRALVLNPQAVETMDVPPVKRRDAVADEDDQAGERTGA